jgi:hypothetical protein
MKRLTLLVLALALPTAQPAALSAQAVGGTVSFHIKTHLPDSISAMTGSADVEMLMTVSTDGEHVAMDMLPQANVPGADGMHIKMVFTLGGDSAHIAILMPQLAASGIPGMRMDMPMSMMASANPLLGGLMDSVSKTLGKVSYRSLKTNSIVAGIRCAEWEAINGTDTTRTCVVPTPPEVIALQDRMSKLMGMKDIVSTFPGLAAAQRDAYGGKAMTPIRTTNAKSGVSMELVSVVAGKPDATAFELPAGLQQMPVPGKPGGRELPK